MRLIDADVLLDNIRRDSKKAIDEGDKVGSFWLGYIAGLVIKQPTIQSALDPETLIRTIEMGITATNSNDVYSLGMRNGMRWCKSLIDGAEPKFEDDVMSVDDGKELPTIQPEKAQLFSEDTTSDMISRQAARHALCKAVHNGEDVPCENQTASCLWTGTRVCDFVREIDALPSVQPERKKGEWIEISSINHTYKCSECGRLLVNITDGRNNVSKYYPYCHCGADMKRESKIK